MTEPTDLDKFRKARAKQTKRERQDRGRGDTLCRRGFHKWQDDPRKQFDVKQGKLISRQVCARCGATRVRHT